MDEFSLHSFKLPLLHAIAIGGMACLVVCRRWYNQGRAHVQCATQRDIWTRSLFSFRNCSLFSHVNVELDRLWHGKDDDSDVGPILDCIYHLREKSSSSISTQEVVSLLSKLRKNKSFDQFEEAQAMKIWNTLQDLSHSLSFDSIALVEEISSSTVIMTFQLLDRYDIFSSLPIDQKTLAQYIIKVERMMPNNPYHNKSHVVDVVQCVAYMLKNFVSVTKESEPSSIYFSEDKSKLRIKLCPLDIFIIVISSVIHDLGHPGYSNSFLLHRSGWFALTKSVNETVHFELARQLLRNKELDYTLKFSKDDSLKLMNSLKFIVLSTDMQRHDQTITEFSLFIDSIPRRLHASSQESIQMSEKECLLVMSMILKVADLGHCARDLSCHFKWVQNLTEEFYLQGDAEKSFNYPICSQHDRKLWVSPLTKDRYKGLPRCVASEQISFLQNTASKTFSCLDLFLTPDNIFTHRVEDNIKYWATQIENSENFEDNIIEYPR